MALTSRTELQAVKPANKKIGECWQIDNDDSIHPHGFTHEGKNKRTYQPGPQTARMHKGRDRQ